MKCDKINFVTIEKQNDETLNDYIEKAYIIFKKSLIDNEIKYNDKLIKVRELPIEDNKVQGFFHVISEKDKTLGLRLYKEDRIKYVPYIAEIIKNYNKCKTCSNKTCLKIKIWSAPYKGKIERIKLYYEQDNYIVILEKRSNYYQLVSAYVVDRKDRKEDILKEYNKYK